MARTSAPSVRGSIAGASLLLVAMVGAVPAAAVASPAALRLAGRVVSGVQPIADAAVVLWAVPASDTAVPPTSVGSGTTTRNGSFDLGLPRDPAPAAAYYLTARRSTQVVLAAVVHPYAGATVVVNERTTVAAAVALAQFTHRGRVSGPRPGPGNAALMAADIADAATGQLAAVLTSSPNGDQTSTMREVNTLANLLVPCVRDAGQCATLLRLATAPGDVRPSDTFDAVAAITRNPVHDVGELFALATGGVRPYTPSLSRTATPDAWTVALRFDGDGRSLNGPGNVAIDARGNVWVSDNYTFSRDPAAPVCGGKQVMEFGPDGRYVAGSPFSGGGLDGVGFGITLDPRGDVWLANYGFSSTGCPADQQPRHDSVSEFSAAGVPLSPSATGPDDRGGYTAGPISYPQGIISDRTGAIWIANCGNDTVTEYPGGDPTSAVSRPAGVRGPFDLALDGRGHLFVTGNASDSVAVLAADGTPAGPPITGGGIRAPLGIAADTGGNMWVADSGRIGIPCPTGGPVDQTQPPSISLITDAGTGTGTHPPTAFTGGGLTIPWGVAVDGADHVWVANFAGQRLSEFCGTTVAACPPGAATGDPISPSTGYGFDGLVRNTGVQIDPSGNVWVTNNWKSFPLPDRNPGGYQVVTFVGAAAPIRTPLIGPPVPLR